MNFLGMGPGELMIILVLALIVFGPQKLPEIGQGLGKAIGEFRRATTQITDEINRELSLDAPPKAETPAAPAAPAPAPSAPVETTASGQAQNDGPLVLEIKPPTGSTTFEAAPVNEAPPTAPVEVISESPASNGQVEDAGEAVVETPRPEPDVSARATRARRARKTAGVTAEATEATGETAAETIEG